VALGFETVILSNYYPSFEMSYFWQIQVQFVCEYVVVVVKSLSFPCLLDVTATEESILWLTRLYTDLSQFS
jgi:hypothetical protein